MATRFARNEAKRKKRRSRSIAPRAAVRLRRRAPRWPLGRRQDRALELSSAAGADRSRATRERAASPTELGILALAALAQPDPVAAFLGTPRARSARATPLTFSLSEALRRRKPGAGGPDPQTSPAHRVGGDRIAPNGTAGAASRHQRLYRSRGGHAAGRSGWRRGTCFPLSLYGLFGGAGGGWSPTPTRPAPVGARSAITTRRSSTPCPIRG